MIGRGVDVDVPIRTVRQVSVKPFRGSVGGDKAAEEVLLTVDDAFCERFSYASKAAQVRLDCTGVGNFNNQLI